MSVPKVPTERSREESPTRSVSLPSFVGDFWNYTQNVMPELERVCRELCEVGGEPAASFVHSVQTLKECVNHFDLGCGFEKSYPEAGPWHS